MRAIAGLSTGVAIAGVLGLVGLLDMASAQAQPAKADAGAAVSRPVFIDQALKGVVAPPKLEDVERLCALLVGCKDVPLPTNNADLGACVREMWGTLAHVDAIKFSLPVRECGLQAKTCDELKTCALRGAAPEKCAQRGLDTDAPVGFCDADGRAVMCWRGKVHSVRDCPRGGEQCAIRDGRAACVLGQCNADASASQLNCSANGQRVLFCDTGKLASINCSAFGLSCVMDPTTQKPGCSAASTPACAANAHRCDGTSYVGCLLGHEVKVECDKGDLVCNSTTGSVAVGNCVIAKPEGTACDPKTAQSKCVGTGVQYCAGGTLHTYSCKKYGQTKCVGAPGAAHCE